MTELTEYRWDESGSGMARDGVYGFAKSYHESGRQEHPGGRPPYFFRGSLADLQIGRQVSLAVGGGEHTLNEEFELILVLERECETKQWELRGFTFGSDLTNLHEFRTDPSRIMWAKAPTAAVLPHYWDAANLPSSTGVAISKSRAGQFIEKYDSRLGADHLTIPLDAIPQMVSSFHGAGGFDRILLFTGAAPGFESRQGCVAPADGDALRLDIPWLGEWMECLVCQSAQPTFNAMAGSS